MNKEPTVQQQLTPSVGEQVIASDGEILGEVKETKGERFKVDAPLQRDYWLDCSAIDVIEMGAVCLSFPKDELESYKQDEPDE